MKILTIFIGVIQLMLVNICYGDEGVINFDQLFNDRESSIYERVLESKKTPRKIANEAKRGTEYISTPRTLIGGVAKEMFTCDDCKPLSDSHYQCLRQCSDKYDRHKSGCRGLSESGFPGYNGSPHHICTSKAYSINSSCENECYRRYR